MLFDTERYIQEIEDDKRVRELKAPNNKVPALNLPKLAPEKKSVAINVSISRCIMNYDRSTSLLRRTL